MTEVVFFGLGAVAVLNILICMLGLLTHRHAPEEPKVEAVTDLYEWKRQRRLQEHNDWMDLYALALTEVPGGYSWERQPKSIYDYKGNSFANPRIEGVEYKVRTRQRELAAEAKLKAPFRNPDNRFIRRIYY